MTSRKWTSIVNRQASTTQHGHKNATQKHVNKTSQHLYNLSNVTRPKHLKTLHTSPEPPELGTADGPPEPAASAAAVSAGDVVDGAAVACRTKNGKKRKSRFCVSLRKLLWDFFWFFRDEVRFASSALDSKSLLLAVQFFSSFQRDGVEANKGKWILFIILSSFCTFHFIGCNITCLFKLACRWRFRKARDPSRVCLLGILLGLPFGSLCLEFAKVFPLSRPRIIWICRPGLCHSVSHSAALRNAASQNDMLKFPASR